MGEDPPDCHESGVLSFIGLTAVNVDFLRSRFFVTQNQIKKGIRNMKRTLKTLLLLALAVTLFASLAMGNGAVIEPTAGEVYSPVSGTVTTADDRQLMFTSIPYDEGWNVYVDGEKVEIYEANNALVAFYVEGAGEHEVVLKYMPTTVFLGIVISITCLAIFILILRYYF